ncbi:MAG: FGGY family carbohydrate kinase [Parasphingorhabdus sp.]|uniref:FGGY family carbohydrate kinase n=1 Tax=Parasphingorhabdus sp. TaxID=2709688 RepID=UPI003299D09D
MAQEQGFDKVVIVADATARLEVKRPKPLHSEQNPDDWMVAVDEAIRQLPINLKKDIGAMGLAGQMHGAVLLGEDNEILRPAILWNDGRSHDQCQTLESAVPRLDEITGKSAMPHSSIRSAISYSQILPEP